MNDKERNAKDLIEELMHLSVLIADLNSEIGFLEGVRHIGTQKPVAKSAGQISEEKKRDKKRRRMEKLKQEVAEKLGVQEEARQVEVSDFPVFLMINFKTMENGELTRINKRIIPPQEASLEMIRNSQLF